MTKIKWKNNGYTGMEPDSWWFDIGKIYHVNIRQMSRSKMYYLTINNIFFEQEGNKDPIESWESLEHLQAIAENEIKRQAYEVLRFLGEENDR